MFRNEIKFKGEGFIRKATSKFEILVDEFFEASCSCQLSKGLLERWLAPDKGWWKINTNAVYSNGKAGIAFVTRDSIGKILYFASKTTQCDSPYEAELQALFWASGYAYDKGWDLIEWSSDAAVVVKEQLNNQPLL